MSNLRSYPNLIFKTKQAGVFDINSFANQDVLSVTTHKDISSPMGNFTILLSPRVAKNLGVSRGTVYISDVLNPFDLVQIQFKTTGNYKTEMIGVISRATVTLTINPQDGKPVRALRIDGFDLGKMAQAFKLYFNPWINQSSGQQYGGNFYFGKDHEIFNNPGLTAASPTQFITNFLNLVFNKIIPGGPVYPLTFPGGIKIYNLIDFISGIGDDFLKYNLVHTMTDPFILLNLGVDKETSIYDIVKAYSDPPFHETFFDLRRATNQSNPQDIAMAESTHTLNVLPSSTYSPTNPNGLAQQQPYVFTMRTTPFSQVNWNALNQCQFIQSDIMHQDTAQSEDNIFNYYIVYCERENFVQGSVQAAQLNKDSNGRIPIIDNKPLPITNGLTYPNSMDTYGIRRYPFTTTKYVEFIYATDHQNSTIIQKQSALARELFRWFSFGELFESGTITLKGRVGIGYDGATMGSRLVEYSTNGSKTGKEYYIEGVMQEWVLGQPLKTTLSVTRGHFPTQAFTIGGVSYPGRFYLVQQQEANLALDQIKNGQFFENIPF